MKDGLIRYSFENFQEPTIWFREDGYVELANKKSGEMIGIPHETIIGGHIDDFFDIDWKIEKQEIKKSRTTKKDILLKSPEGDQYFKTTFDKVVLNGEEYYVVRVLEEDRDDIFRHELLKNYSIENADDAIYWINKDADISYANRAAERLLGYTSSEIVGLKVFDIDPNFSKKNWEVHWEELTEKRHFKFMSTSLTKSKETIPVEISVNYLEFGGQSYNCAFVHDLRGIKKIEATADRADRTLNNLLYHSSHALRSPITNIMGLLDLLSHHDIDPEGKHYLNKITEVTKRSGQMLRELTWLADIRNRDVLNIETVSIGSIFKNLVSDLSNIEIDDGIERITDWTGEDSFETDYEIFYKILLNLVKNSISHRRKDSGDFVRVTIHNSNGQVDMIIEDNGEGIEDIYHERIYDLFFVANRSGRNIGNGLGLYIVKYCTEKLGGTIDMESIKGEGSKFKLTQLIG